MIVIGKTPNSLKNNGKCPSKGSGFKQNAKNNEIKSIEKEKVNCESYKRTPKRSSKNSSNKQRVINSKSSWKTGLIIVPEEDKVINIEADTLVVRCVDEQEMGNHYNDIDNIVQHKSPGR